MNTQNPLKKDKNSRSLKAPKDVLANKPSVKLSLRLYVAGATDRSRQALRHVYQQCEAEMKGAYELDVIDVYQQPEMARENQIVATPTLVKCLPLPARRFIGSLTDLSGLFGELDPAVGTKIAS